jgi:hypothetical protein
MTTYKFHKFNYIDQDIIFPEDIVLYRGIESKTKLDIIRNNPIYLGPEYIAEQYGDVYKITANKPLKLIDIRKLKNILRMVILSRVSNDGSILQSIRYLTIAFGLCSYVGQVKLLEEYVASVTNLVIDKAVLKDIKSKIQKMKQIFPTDILNPLEPEGVRIAETTIDGKVMLILKELFSGIYDGFIAPKLWSPFHKDSYSHEEIVIFDPIKSKLDIYEATAKPKILELETVLNDNYKSYNIKDAKYPLKIYSKFKDGGTSSRSKSPDRNTFYDDMNTHDLKEAIKAAKFFKENVNIEAIKYKKPYLKLSSA